MKEKINKFKKWLFRPVSAKVKSNGIIYGIVALFVYSVILSFFTHWFLCIVPILLIALVLYCAKLPIDVKKTLQDKMKMEEKRNAKNQK